MKLSSRRALSTVVTTAILLAAVAVLGTSVVAWSRSNLQTYESNLSNISANNTNKIQENVIIENVAFCKNCKVTNSSNYVNITLTNTGNLAAKITGVQINYTTATTDTTTPVPVTIPVKGTTMLMTKLPGTSKWSSGKPDQITITTSRGNIFSKQAVPR